MKTVTIHFKSATTKRTFTGKDTNEVMSKANREIVDKETHLSFHHWEGKIADGSTLIATYGAWD